MEALLKQGPKNRAMEVYDENIRCVLLKCLYKTGFIEVGTYRMQRASVLLLSLSYLPE